MHEAITRKPAGPRRSVARKVLITFVSITIALVVTHLVFQYLNLEVYNQQNGQVYELSNRFDLDDESSLPTWFSQFLFLAISLTATLSAFLQKQRRSRRVWGLIALIALLFSIDEISTLHERLLQTIHVTLFQDNIATSSANAWLVISPVIVALGAWLMWLAWRTLPKRTVKLFVFAGGVFLVGAVFVDLLANTTDRETFINQGLVVGAEEAMELFAGTIALYTIVDYLERKYSGPLRAAIASLKSGRD